jgi:uncharacterized membrane-anchored protein
MASTSERLPKKPRSFDPPQEPEWHRMIAEAAYYLAEKRGFLGEHSLADWLAAEQQVRQVISPIEITMNDTPETQPKTHARTPADAKAPVDATKRQGVSRFEKFAATQAAGDGIEGDVLKSGKTVDEKLGANMADRK